jgi:hypothetical protein
MFGGRLENAEPLPGKHRYRPKFNGRRVLLHLPTMRTWNRQLEEVGYMHPTFKKLQLLVGPRWLAVEWLDLEFLWGRTSIGKGAIIVLDYVAADMDWVFRQIVLHDIFADNQLEDLDFPEKGQVYWSAPLREGQESAAWKHMQEINKENQTTFYEGLVAYDITSEYPIQLFSPTRVTRHWMKYRFID